MISYSFEITNHRDEFSYSEMEFVHFKVREVIFSEEIRNNNYGEYHIKILDKSSVDNAVSFFKRRFPGCEVELIDPGNLLNLEYQIYIKVNDPLTKDSMIESFENINDELISHKRKVD